jgi:hypothetical protein
VDDPVDESVKPLASVPWVRDLPKRYRQRYGEDILAVRRSLFEGDSESARQVRQRFWALISDLIAERYFGQIQEWTRAHHIASSGHLLWEERPLHHVPFVGNALKVLRRMDIPGMDMLSSNPHKVIYRWLAASLPASAALFNGGRRVMTEVSDIEEMRYNKPASLPKMRATAAWQAALGVTEFTLYYPHKRRQPKDYRAYCDFVGRVNALLRQARLAPRVLLYYPVYDLWGAYMPVAEELTLESQPQRARQIVKSFTRLGELMVTRQIPFALVDHELLADAKVCSGGMWIGGQQFAALVLPAGVKLPASAAAKVDRFKAAGGRMFREKVSEPGIDFNALAGVYENGALSVRTERVVVGRFTRDGREMLLVVNVGTRPYTGKVAAKNEAGWLVADPASGKIERAKTDGTGEIVLSLPSYSTVLLIGPPPNAKTVASR